MKLKLPVVFIAGISAVLVYLIFTLVAFINFSGPYHPLANWLSDLGNPNANPNGWFYYNTGCILTGLLLVVFYIGLRQWNTGNKRMKVLMTIAQVSGILASCSLIVSAILPLGVNSPVHSFASAMLSVFLGFFLTFSATALLKHPAFMKWVAFYGFITALVNFIYGAFLHEVFIAEWIAIGMFIVYVLLIACNSRLLPHCK